MAETALGTVLDFLQEFGFFDVILPFLLIFTVVFGILEKTKIFGVDEVDGKKYPKKNINAMVAFAIGFFVVAAKEVVASLKVSLPNVALVLIIAICFMMLAGSFLGDKEFSFEERRGWLIFLTVIMFIAILLIFLNSLGWLSAIIAYIIANTSTVLLPLVLLIVVVVTILFVVGKKPKSEGS